MSELRYTASDLELLLRDGADYELLNGELLKVSPANFAHGIVSGEIGRILGNYAIEHNLGEVLGAGTGICFTEYDLLAPDAAFISHEKLTASAVDNRGWLTIAPDLVVEIASHRTTADDLDQKIDRFFNFGVRLVWVLYPTTQKIMVYHAKNQTQILLADDTLSGDPVLSGFTVAVSDLFRGLAFLKAEQKSSRHD